jgi:protein-L-isoaspartate(D-aspartate) O-methyltransferase
MENLERVRSSMIENHLKARGVRDPAVLRAMNVVPREAFVPKTMAEFAYEDSPLPIGEGQTISQPYIVAVMTEMLELDQDGRVLEIGTGSGYAAAIMSRVVREVHTVERHAALADSAEQAFRRLGYDNIQVHRGDGSLGLPAHAPYEAIAVTAGAPDVPETLKEQLAVGGRMVIPIGVVYSPETELQSHYFYAELARQFDEYIWFEETRAVTPLTTEAARGLPRTFPFGV